MVRSAKSRAEPRDDNGLKGPGVRRSKSDPCKPLNMEEDPLKDLRVPYDEEQDQASDEYVWPQFDDEDND